jgi:Tetratricopeptide repeat
MTSALGLLFLMAAPAPPPEAPASEPTSMATPEAPGELPLPAPPQHDAFEHLERAHQLEAAGDLDAAEAEVSTAISLQPDDAPAYLVRAQLRMSLADRYMGADAAERRARAVLLRLAAGDVGAYVEHAELPSDGVAWFRARREALLREAEALDPPAPEPAPEPEPTVASPTRSSSDVGAQRPRGAWIGTGAGAAGAGAVLAAASLRIEQRCTNEGPCGVRWQVRAPFMAPAAVLATLGTTSIVLGLAAAPALDRPGPRRAVLATGLALGATATALGTITGALAGARWHAPASPSDDASLGVTQTLGNVAAASFSAALPLLSAGVTAWVRGRLARPPKRLALRGRMH